jgi:hypothetical protein
VDPHLTGPDRQLLAFAAEHRIVLATQVQAIFRLLPEEAEKRLSALFAAGCLTSAQPFNGPPCYRIAGAGLDVLGSDLSTPRPIRLGLYRHDIGVGWAWIAAHKGVWGDPSEVISERTMRSRDAIADAAGEPTRESRLGVRLGGFGAAGAERRHYPDLIVVTAEGHRLAVELELSAKGRARRETILAGYAADARIDAVLYLVDRPEVGRAVSASASRIGISDLVHVQRIQWGEDLPPISGRSAEAAGQRTRTPSTGRPSQLRVER